MKSKLMLLALIMIAPFFAKSQSKLTGYRSSHYVEFVWSKTKSEFVELETLQKPSGFVMNSSMIGFKKGGSSSWLFNKWEYNKESSQKDKRGFLHYFDERDQVVIIDYKNGILYYYYNYDQNSKKYMNLTEYRSLVKDDKQLTEYNKEETDDSDESNSPAEKAEKFRIDCSKVSIYDYKKEKWDDWVDGNNTFVININNNGDILHITAKGKEKTYRRISRDVERDQTKTGDKYQIIEVLDEEGDRFRFQVFDDIEIGVKMIYPKFMIQFSK